MTQKPDPDRIKILARVELQRTDWKLSRALERSMASPEWCDWRDAMRDIASHPEGHAEPLPPEPAFGSPAVRLEPAYDPPAEPEPSILDAALARIAELEAENARLKEPAHEPHNFPANFSDKLTDWAEPGDLTTDQLTEDVIQKLTKAKRKKFTELLNVELAELQQERGGPREDLKRENEIEALLGLFARVGEM